MLNIKSFYIIDKDKIPGVIHVVGVGALGSLVVANLVRLNLASKIIVYDDDIVEEKNLNNQVYLKQHIGLPKVEALRDYCRMVDSDSDITIKNKRVEYLRTKSTDIVVLAIDNFNSRGKILSQIEGTPLVISGGISSIGGNFEIVRGKEHYESLSDEYLALKSGQEYDENDLTPCGSPISIYHRINFAASLICDAIVNKHSNIDNTKENIVFDIPNLLILNV